MGIKGLVDDICIPAPVLSIHQLHNHLKGSISWFFTAYRTSKLRLNPSICPDVDAGPIAYVPEASLF
jgi:hypothetical protein